VREGKICRGTAASVPALTVNAPCIALVAGYPTEQGPTREDARPPSVLTEWSHLPVSLHSQVVVAAEKVNKEMEFGILFLYSTESKNKIK